MERRITSWNVIPAKAGIQWGKTKNAFIFGWIPAFAGMTAGI